MTEPLIVTADFAPADLAFLDAERRAHFPPHRNILPAHLTLFHALPPSVESELRRRLAEASHRLDGTGQRHSIEQQAALPQPHACRRRDAGAPNIFPLH